MTAEKAVNLSEDFGLAGLAFTEHSRHLYFSRQHYGGDSWFKEGITAAEPEESRIRDYLKLKKRHERQDVRFGIEADCDSRGNLLLRREDRLPFDYVIGAIHKLPGLAEAPPPAETPDGLPSTAAGNAFLFLVEKLVSRNIDVLAHPFRVFKRSGLPVPSRLFAPAAELLRAHNTAAEINFHTNTPPADFIRECLRLGVKVTFASDAHHLAEVGDFALHLSLLKEAGFDGPLSDILAAPTIPTTFRIP
jgi:histidinol phosphatase-like PHP family hydrolase